MPCAAPTDSAPSPCPRILGTLSAYAVELIDRIKRAVTHQVTAYLPQRIARAVHRNPITAVARVESGLDLVIALARTLAGDVFYLPIPRPAPRPIMPQPDTAREAKPRPAPRARAVTEADRDRDRLRRLRHTMQTQPIRLLARRITRKLGLSDTHDAFPHVLMEMNETPAQWSHRLFGPRRPRTPAIIVPRGWKPPRPLAAPALEPEPDSEPEPDPQAPRYHKLE